MVTQVGRVAAKPNPLLEAAQVAASGTPRGFKRSFYVDVSGGFDGAGGSGRAGSPLATIARAAALIQSGDQIVLFGKAREQVVFSNLLGYVEIVGASKNSAYGDSPWGGGSAWLAPASATASVALATVRGQGFSFESLLMDPPADAACVELERNALSGSSEYDGSHAAFRNVRFAGGQSGIEVDGGAYNVLVEECGFQALTNGIKCLNTAVDVSTAWRIRNNRFFGSTTNEIISSFIDSIISGNRFHDLGSTVHINTKYNSGQGARNHVIHNYFPETNANIKEDDGFLGTATDYWRNFATGTAGEVVESPPGAS